MPEQIKINKKAVFFCMVLIMITLLFVQSYLSAREDKYIFVAKQYCSEQGKTFFELEHKVDCNGFSCIDNSYLDYHCFSKEDTKMISNSTAWKEKYGEDWNE